MSLDKLRIFYASVRLSWGFIARFKEVTASQPAHVLPTPSTVVGAFGYPLARILGYRDGMTHHRVRHGSGWLITGFMKGLLEATVMASAGVVSTVGLATSQEMSRLAASMYKGGSEKGRMISSLYEASFYAEALPRIFPVLSLGSTYGPGAKLVILWVARIDKLANALNAEEEEIDRVGKIAVLGVTRIGSKEGIVAVEPEESGYISDPNDIEVITSGSISTNQYVISNCVEPLELVPQIELPDLVYRLQRYYVPSLISTGKIVIPLLGSRGARFLIKEPCKAYTAKELKELAVVGVGV